MLALGERGEIAVRGPNIMKGYWKNPEATREAISPDGYLRTGDVGWMDEDGYVYIVDRTKDMLLCGGFNVYPRVIEEAIYQHASVAEVAVIGVPDEYRGQAPKAFVKLRPDAPELSLEELKAFLKPRIGKHEMVASLQIVDALPRTPVGKIDKKPITRGGVACYSAARGKGAAATSTAAGAGAPAGTAGAAISAAITARHAGDRR